MPEFHPTLAGLFVAGNAGDGGVVSSNDGRVVLGPSAGNVHWYQDTEAVCQYYDPHPPHVVAVDVMTGVPRDLLLHGANKIVAGSGHWFADKILDGVMVDYNVRAFAGDYMAWFPWNGTGLYIRKWSTGVDVVLSTTLGPEEPIQLFPDGSCIWAEGGLPHAYAISDFPPNPVVLSEGIGWLKGFKINDVWWLVYQSYALASVVEHPATELIGYKQSAPNAFRLDVTTLTSLPQIIFSKGQADAPQDIQIEIIDPTKKRIDLTAVAPIQKAPKISVLEWAPEIKAGALWPVKFKDEGTETIYDFSKDAKDQLQIGATSSFGSDHTGAVRQLTVVGPTPKPLPPRIMERYTVSMAIASADFVQTFDHLPTGCCINIPIQNVIYEGANQGPNTSQALIAGDVYRKAKEHGNPLVIEMGSVKPGDCQCVNALQNMEWAINVVREHGGEVACITQDEPLTANADGCHMSTQAVADYVAEFTHKARELGVPVGLIEAWPHVPFDTVKEFLGYLQMRDALPVHWRADIYWDNTTDAKASKFIHDARQLAESLGITFGVYVNSTKDPIATDAEHRANLKTLAQRIYKIVPDVAHVVVAAWAFRTTGGLQDVPSNLTPDGLLASYGDVKTIFDQSSVPQPEPKPEDNVRFAKLIEWKDPAGTTLSLSVKEINDIGDGLSTLILPDFVENNVTLSNKVFSYQPTGKPGDGQKWWRDEGTKGAWERCKVNGNAATFRPAADDVTILFSLVGTL